MVYVVAKNRSDTYGQQWEYCEDRLGRLAHVAHVAVSDERKDRHAEYAVLERLNRLGGGNGLVQYFHPEMFCRMLGKIAHSYAVAELGVDGFKPLLNEI